MNYDKFILFFSGEVRNDFYVTLRSGEFEKGSKSAQRNVEVKVTLYDSNGQLIKVCQFLFMMNLNFQRRQL